MPEQELSMRLEENVFRELNRVSMGAFLIGLLRYILKINERPCEKNKTFLWSLIYFINFLDLTGFIAFSLHSASQLVDQICIVTDRFVADFEF